MKASHSTSVSSGYTPLVGRFDEWKDGRSLEGQWDDLTHYLDSLGTDGVNELQRQSDDLLRDSGIMAEGADFNSVSRPYTIDPIPLLLSAQDYQFIEKAVSQRAEILNSVLQDCYDEQSLVKEGVLSPRFLFKQPGFNRALKGCLPKKASYLHFYAVDLGRTPKGEWVVLKDHTESPPGLGIALENRIVTTNVFGDFLKDQRLLRLVHFLQSYRDSLYAEAPAGVDESLVVHLTSKEHDPSYYEEVYLSKYLGIPLVDGGELTVRDDRLYLKTVSGLMRVHVVVRGIHEEEVDPLASPVSSYNGVPGLMQVMRAGNVRVLNPPGTGLVEDTSLYEALPQLAQRYTQKPLLIPSVKTEHTSCSSSPVFKEDELRSYPITMRFFSYFDGEKYQVMPGGLATYLDENKSSGLIYEGGKDIWVLTQEETEETKYYSLRATQPRLKRNAGLLSSRAADNLFWLGRYGERSEYVTRLILEIVLNITEEQQRMDLSSVDLLLKVLKDGHFLPKSSAPLHADRARLFQTLSDIFFITRDRTSYSNTVPDALSQLSRLTALSRARLSNELSRIVRQMEKVRHTSRPADFTDFRKVLQQSILYHSAFNGACLSNLTRTRGWHFVSIGKSLEHVYWLGSLTQGALAHYPKVPSSLLDSLLSVNETTLTYRFRYQSAPELGCVLDLILFDPLNSRSLYTQLKNVESSLMVLIDGKEAFNTPVLLSVRRAMNFLETELIDLTSEGAYRASILKVQAFLDTTMKELPMISEKLGWEFFTHVDFRPL